MNKLPELTEVELVDGTHGVIVYVYDDFDDYEIEFPPQPGFDEWEVKTVPIENVARAITPDQQDATLKVAS